jgi:hypothetical protein
MLMETVGTDNLAVIILASVSILYQLRRASIWLAWKNEISRVSAKAEEKDFSFMISTLQAGWRKEEKPSGYQFPFAEAVRRDLRRIETREAIYDRAE